MGLPPDPARGQLIVLDALDFVPTTHDG